MIQGTDITKDHLFNITMGDFKESYCLVETTSTQNYDYGYCIQIYKSLKNRFVLIPRDRVEYQTARYDSGLYTSFLHDNSMFAHISNQLIKRLFEEGTES